VNILGVHDGWTATAALLKDGRIVAAASEERFTRVKNQPFMPFNAIQYVLSEGRVERNELDWVVLSSNYYFPVPELDRTQFSLYKSLVEPFARLTFSKSKRLSKLAGKKIAPSILRSKVTTKRIALLARFLQIEEEKIVTADHHTLHAVSTLFASPLDKNERTLIFTMDAEGDFVSSTVYLWENSNLKRLVYSSYADSLGILWVNITKYLGMKPHEHEYKVMGLAPYAPEYGIKKVLPKLRRLITLKDDLTFECALDMHYVYPTLRQTLDGVRFDSIAGAIQKLTQELLYNWVRKTVERYQAEQAAFGGGVFMNIKANMKIAEIKRLKRLFFMPSAGDESQAIGAVYFGFYHFAGKLPEPLSNLYLGPSFTKERIEQELAKYPDLEYTFYNDIDDVVSELLTNGEIVARFSDRMEWGARALGNRSILADPSNWDTVRRINVMIKQRDFWMPFAPTILEDQALTYVTNPSPSRVDGQYMIIGFLATNRAQKELKATMHPYDGSLRPQLLPLSHNPDYYNLVKRFASSKGIYGVLNTSFNLHGEPIVCSPSDAIHTLRDSGLEFLAIGHFLATKKHESASFGGGY